MTSAAITNEFAAPGTYSVRLGESFTSQGSKDACSFYSLKFNGRLDPTMSSRKATLQKLDDDSYAADWGPIEGSADKTELNYDATPGKVQEMDCILLFDEATQTFTLQRPTLKLTVRKSRRSRKRKVVEPELPLPKAAKTKPEAAAAAKRPAPVSTRVVEERRSSVDDFAKDIENNMLELLEDDDDDDDDDEDQSVTTAPSAPVPSSDTDTFEEVVHPHKWPSTDSPATMNRKRKYKMASQPIRRLDDSPQPPQSTVSPVQRPQYAGKSISPAVMAANRGQKAAVESSSESSSGSSSSEDSGSSSSGDSGSSSSGSEDDSSGSDSDDSSDDDMEDLAANITRSLSADTQSVPPSPARPYSTPLVPDSSPYSASPAARETPTKGAPTSLRQFLTEDGDDDQEEEGSTTDDDD